MTVLSILVVGSLNVDTTLTVDHLPEPGETILATRMDNSRGGKGQNQAVAMSRLGCKVKMIGAVGKDEKGSDILNGLEKEGVETTGILLSETDTGMASIYLDSLGNNNIVVFPGANYSIHPEDIDNNVELFQDVEYCVMQLEIPLDVIYRTLEVCNKYNITTILNPAPVNMNFDERYFCLIDYLVPNETELSLLTGEEMKEENISELAKVLLVKGCKNVLTTLGSEGSLLVNQSEEVRVKGIKVQAVDSTAAGDSYIGGLVASLSAEKNVKEAMEYATRVASVTVTKKGAIDSLPYLQEIE